jgi:hypothetical protein
MGLLRLFPERTDFIAYFRDAAATAAEAARLLNDLVAGQAHPEQAANTLQGIMEQRL